MAEDACGASNGGIDLGGQPHRRAAALSHRRRASIPAIPISITRSDRFRSKVDSGAEWAITQPVFDVQAMEAFLEYLYKRSIAVPVIMGIWPLTSLRNAQFMNNEVPGVSIPASILARMAVPESPKEAASEGVEIAREMYAAMIDRIQGAQLSAPFGRVEHALRVLGKA